MEAFGGIDVILFNIGSLWELSQIGNLPFAELHQ